MLLLILLNLLISRIVIAPVRNVQQAMSRAATGDLEVLLPVHSRDELGAMADAFNRMVAELFASKREVLDYSHNLETMVAARTHALQESEVDLLDLKNRLATVLANVATGVVSLDEEGRIETFNERAGEILGTHRERDGTQAQRGPRRRHAGRARPRGEGAARATARASRRTSSASFPRAAAPCPSWSPHCPARAGRSEPSWSARTSPRSSPPSASKPGRKRWRESSTSSRTR